MLWVLLILFIVYTNAEVFCETKYSGCSMQLTYSQCSSIQDTYPKPSTAPIESPLLDNPSGYSTHTEGDLYNKYSMLTTKEVSSITPNWHTFKEVPGKGCMRNDGVTSQSMAIGPYYYKTQLSSDKKYCFKYYYDGRYEWTQNIPMSGLNNKKGTASWSPARYAWSSKEECEIQGSCVQDRQTTGIHMQKLNSETDSADFDAGSFITYNFTKLLTDTSYTGEFLDSKGKCEGKGWCIPYEVGDSNSFEYSQGKYPDKPYYSRTSGPMYGKISSQQIWHKDGIRASKKECEAWFHCNVNNTNSGTTINKCDVSTTGSHSGLAWLQSVTQLEYKTNNKKYPPGCSCQRHINKCFYNDITTEDTRDEAYYGSFQSLDERPNVLCSEVKNNWATTGSYDPNLCVFWTQRYGSEDDHLNIVRYNMRDFTGFKRVVDDKDIASHFGSGADKNPWLRHVSTKEECENMGNANGVFNSNIKVGTKVGIPGLYWRWSPFKWIPNVYKDHAPSQLCYNEARGYGNSLTVSQMAFLSGTDETLYGKINTQSTCEEQGICHRVSQRVVYYGTYNTDYTSQERVLYTTVRRSYSEHPEHAHVIYNFKKGYELAIHTEHECTTLGVCARRLASRSNYDVPHDEMYSMSKYECLNLCSEGRTNWLWGATCSSLDSTDPFIWIPNVWTNHTYVDRSKDAYYICNKEEATCETNRRFVVFSTPGNAGPSGVDAINGAQGSIGPTGPIGSTPPPINTKGEIGAKGSTGPQGPQGGTYPPINTKGEPGAKGSTGPQGPPGSGPEGPQGPHNYVQGEIGMVGPMGPMGASPKGFTGERGDRGLKGILGPRGPVGDTGNKGFKGEKGDNGRDGYIWGGRDLQAIMQLLSGTSIALSFINFGVFVHVRCKQTHGEEGFYQF